MYSKTKYFLITFTFFIFASCKHTCLYDIHKITTPPTCTQEGVQTFECSICNDSFSSILPKIDHLYQTTDIIEATCEIDGSETKTCQYCNNSYTTTILAVGIAEPGILGSALKRECAQFVDVIEFCKLVTVAEGTGSGDYGIVQFNAAQIDF